jgi:hypothetical protein
MQLESLMPALALLGGWFVLSKWVLPKFGIPT